MSIAAPHASAGELAYKGCITGDANLGPSGSGACEEIPSAAPDGVYSGFGNPSHAIVSPDGKSLYTGSWGTCVYVNKDECRPYAEAAVDRFSLDSATGALAYQGCLGGATEVGPSGSGACALIPTASRGAWRSGLGGPRAMALSPDGKSLYVASQGGGYVICGGAPDCPFGSNALAIFDRYPPTGALTWRGCVSGDANLGPSGSGACAEIPSATDGGWRSGLTDLRSVAVSSDDDSVYTSSYSDSAIARFERDPDTGALTWRGCITGDKGVGPSGSGACAQVPGTNKGPKGSGIGGLATITLSDDGKSLYAVAHGDGGDDGGDLARFDRNPSSGALTYKGCVTGDTSRGPSGSGACTEVPGATPGGRASGLGSPQSPVVSPDGTSVYVGATLDRAISQFERNPATGALTFARCITVYDVGSCKRVPNVGDRGLEISADGQSLYATSGGIYDGNVTRFDREPATGKLTWRDCITGHKWERSEHCHGIPGPMSGNVNPAFFPSSIALNPEGTALYAAGGPSVARLAFAPQTRILSGPEEKLASRAVFKFRSGQPSTFECKLKGKRVREKLRYWRECGSSTLRKRGRERYRKLRPGKKVFKVRATNDVGTTDPTAAKRRWRGR